jgi:hypothetical protein
LRSLNVEGTSITDVGLEHLAGLADLQSVAAVRTKVTKAGVEKLKKARPKVFVSVGD